MDTPHQPVPQHIPQRVMTGVGIATAALNVVLILLLGHWNRDRLIEVTLVTVPALWAVGAAWMNRPLDANGRYSRVGSVVMAMTLTTVVTSVIMMFGLAASVMTQTRQGTSNANISWPQTPLAFLTCCGWPAGVVCGVYVLTTCFGRLWRTANGGMTDIEDDTPAEGQP